MRALVVTTSYPVQRQHFGGRFVADLLRDLGTAGWQFDVVLPAWRETGREVHAENVRLVPTSGLAEWTSRGLAHGRGIPETLARHPWRWIASPGLLTSLAGTASRELERNHYDLVWSHWLLPGGVAGAWASRVQRIPHLATAHGGDVHLLERWSRLPGARALWEQMWSRTTLAAPVAHTARRVRQLLPGRQVLAAPLSAGSPARGPSARATEPNRFLFLGRFEPVKGPDLLLAAFQQLPVTPSAMLWFAGDGSLARPLRRTATPLGARVCFLGALEGDAKRLALRRAAALVLPSRVLADGRAEGFPHAAMEALVLGVPVVCPRRGALGEYITETGGGYTYDAEGSDASVSRRLAEVLSRIAARPEERRQRAERARRAGRPFVRTAACEGWDRLLRSVAAVA